MKNFDFAGMDAKMEQLMRSAQAGRIVHALLFTGPHGTGKMTMAQLFARAALCTATGGEKPCDVCPACKKCLNGSHSDVHIVVPEKNIIKVDQIRALLEELALASHEGGKKIAIIEHADRMNESAQNALLKTLESPTGDVMFFLLTDAPGALLPTILSRCLQLRFDCLDVRTCADVLIRKGIPEDRAALLAALSQGSVGRALEIHADEDYLKQRENVLDALENMHTSADVLRATAKIGDNKDRQDNVLEIMELWARDLMRVQNGAEPAEQTELQRLRKSAFSGSILIRQIILLRKKLEANVSWVNALESMDFALTDQRL